MLLEIKDLSFTYEGSDNPVLRSINFNCNPGEIIAVRGPSGSGKSTLLYAICGVIPKIFTGNYQGNVIFNKIDISTLTLPQTAPQISLLLQEADNQLFLPRVEDELAFGPENLALSPDLIRERIRITAKSLDLESILHEPVSTLSYGLKKIVAFASILTLDPEVFLLDEPSSGMSEKYLHLLTKVIKDLQNRGKIVFIADHDEQLLSTAEREINFGHE